jgi:hypothetical protein
MNNSDMIGDNPRGPKAEKPMEFHRFSRLPVNPINDTESELDQMYR